jgi:phosphoserine phosphatase
LSSPELRSQAVQFIESVRALRLALAVFDCDGTLWSGDAGADFFYWELERGIVGRDVAGWARARYEEYKAGRVSEEQMCGEMVTMNHGVSHEALQRTAEKFFDEVVRPRVFPEMQELTRHLAAQGCDVWAVSSTNSWVVEVGAARLGIAPDRVLAACVHLDDGCASDRLIRVPTDELKALAIREVIAKPVDAVFGNSVHDQAMLEMAKYPFCVNPNADLERIARARGWPVYWPEGSRQ